jgi:hypothetical protein
LFFLPFTWGRHRRACATTALPRATSLELLILFDFSSLKVCLHPNVTTENPICKRWTKACIFYPHSKQPA